MSLSVNRVGVTPNYSPAFNGRCEKCESGSTLKTVAMTGLAALGMVGAAMIALKKGKALGKIAGELEALKNQKYLDVNDFKKVGEFKKGVATIDGKGFTGQLFHPTRNTVLSYKNGQLLKSEVKGKGLIKTYGGKTSDGSREIVTIEDMKYNGANVEAIQKVDGTRIITRTPKYQAYKCGTRSHFEEDSRRFKTVVSPDGKVQKIRVSSGTIQNPNFKNGRELRLWVERDIDTGKVLSSDYIVKPDPVLPRDKYHVYPKWSDSRQVDKRVKTTLNGEKVTEKYQTRRDGKLIREVAYSGSYNPKTGILTKAEHNCDFSTGEYTGSKWITMTDKNNKNNKLRYHVDKNGEISEVHLHAAGKGEIVGSEYCNRGGTLEEAQAKIKEFNLPFVIG